MHHQIRHCSALIVLISIAYANVSLAQVGRDSSFYKQDSIGAASLDSIASDKGPDTTIYDLVEISNPFAKTPIDSITLGQTSSFDPTETWGNLSLHTGNFGGSTTPAVLTFGETTKVSLGYGRQYDPYFINQDEYRMMSINRPYSEVYFSPFLGQQNFIAKGKLSQNIGKQHNFTIDYQRYRQTAYYDRQATKTSSIGTSYWAWSKKKNYHAILSYFGRFVDEEQNGGIATDTTLHLISSRQKTAIPVRLNGAESRFHDYNINLDQHLRIGKEDNRIDLHSRLGFTTGLSKFVDQTTRSTNDTLIYKSYLTDPSGVRNYVKFQTLEAAFDAKARLFDLVAAEGYIGYWRHRMDYDRNLTRDINQLLLGVKGGFDWNESLKLIGTFEVSTIGSREYFLSSILASYTANWIDVSGEVYRKNLPIDIVDRTAYILTTPIYDNDYTSVNLTGLKGKLQIKPTSTTIGIVLDNIDSALYYDVESLPQQSSDNVNRLELSLEQKIRLGIFHFDNVATYQSLTPNLWHLPWLVTQTYLYVQDGLFDDKLRYRVGIYGRLIFSDKLLDYQPVNRAFYGMDGTAPDLYPRADTYVVINIGGLEAFFRYENIYNYASQSSEVNRSFEYQVANYPHYDARFRLGLRWKLRD